MVVHRSVLGIQGNRFIIIPHIDIFLAYTLRLVQTAKTIFGACIIRPDG